MARSTVGRSGTDKTSENRSELPIACREYTVTREANTGRLSENACHPHWVTEVRIKKTGSKNVILTEIRPVSNGVQFEKILSRGEQRSFQKDET